MSFQLFMCANRSHLIFHAILFLNMTMKSAVSRSFSPLRPKEVSILRGGTIVVRTFYDIYVRTYARTYSGEVKVRTAVVSLVRNVRTYVRNGAYELRMLYVRLMVVVRTCVRYQNCIRIIQMPAPTPSSADLAGGTENP